MIHLESIHNTPSSQEATINGNKYNSSCSLIILNFIDLSEELIYYNFEPRFYISYRCSME